MKVAQINRIRALLTELGIVFAQDPSKLVKQVRASLEGLPEPIRITFIRMLDQLTEIEKEIAYFDLQITVLAKANLQTQQLMRLPGIGVLTATAMVAMIGNGDQFSCGRQLSAFLGLVPRQNSSGGEARLGHITKGGDSYLRTLLIMGAKSVMMSLAHKEELSSVNRWSMTLKKRRGYGRTVIALAAKNARMCWASLQLGDAFVMPK